MNGTNTAAKPVKETGGLRRANFRDYFMYIALVAIFVVFGIATNGLFLSARNISDLINQTGYVAILAIGMTLILIIKHIDLSVGYVAGFCGAVAATLLAAGAPVFVAIILILGLGIVIGMYQGFLVSKIKIPAFVVTLAGMFIFRGLLSLITAGTGTIIVQDEAFKALSNGYIPDFSFNTSDINTITLVVGAAGALFAIVAESNRRRNMQRYNFEVGSKALYAAKLVLITAIIMIVTWILANYKGIPWTMVIVGIVLFIYNFLLNRTRFGRSIYGIGGNQEAAELSGINVTRVTFITFISMSMLAALAGILYTSRLSSATPTAGMGFELDAIASSYIGGVAVSGGIGKVTNSIIGALVIMSLTNGMNLLGVDISIQYIVKGIIFIVAVAFDIVSRKQAR